MCARVCTEASGKTVHDDMNNPSIQKKPRCPSGLSSGPLGLYPLFVPDGDGDGDGDGEDDDDGDGDGDGMVCVGGGMCVCVCVGRAFVVLPHEGMQLVMMRWDGAAATAVPWKELGAQQARAKQWRSMRRRIAWLGRTSVPGMVLLLLLLLFLLVLFSLFNP